MRSRRDTVLLRGDFSTEVEDQIRRRWIDAELANHAHHLSAMKSRVVGDVLQLIDERHRTRVTAEKFERELRGQSWFIKGGNVLSAPIDKFGPACF